MRAYLASSIGVACTAALALPLALHPGPAQARAERAERTVAAGSTQSLPLRPLRPLRSLEGGGPDRGVAAGRGGAVVERGVTASGVRPFSLVGVVWNRPAAELRGRAEVRTRAVGGAWSPWRELLPYGDEGPDPDSPELRGARAHGGTAPLWVGASDAVQARVRPERAATDADAGSATATVDARAGGAGSATADAGSADAATAGAGALPSGLRLELIEPGEPTAPPGRTGPRSARFRGIRRRRRGMGRRRARGPVRGRVRSRRWWVRREGRPGGPPGRRDRPPDRPCPPRRPRSRLPDPPPP